MHYQTYKSLLSAKNGMNIYRGCLHGCIYCDSRSKCYQINHEFEDIEIKENAPEILDYELSKKKNRIMVGTGSMTDPYLPIESQIQYTKKCLEIIYKHKDGVSFITKSDLVLRDLELLKKINDSAKVVVQMTLTTADDNLCKIIEPNVCVTSRRVEVLKIMAQNNIPTIVWLCPFLPYINDTEENLYKLLDYCSEAKVYGIIFFGFGLTLREGNRDYFYKKLEKHFPGLKEKYIKEFGDRYMVSSSNSQRLTRILIKECRKRNIVLDNDKLFKYMNEFPKEYEQLKLF